MIWEKVELQEQMKQDLFVLFNKVGFTKQKRKESIASNYIESAA